MGGISRTADNFYALRMARLLHQDFKDWKAFQLGVINAQGEVVKKAETDKEKDAWTKFHVAVRNIKRLVNYVPGGKLALRFGASYMLLREMQDAYQLTDEFGQTVEQMFESMVAGDAGGAPGAIAAGATSGAITSPGPNGTNVIKRKLRTFLDVAKEHDDKQAIKVC